MSIEPPQMSPEEARLRNCVAGLADPIPFDLAGETRALSLQPSGDALLDAVVTLPFAIGGEAVALQLGDSFLTEQQLEEQGIVDFNALPESLRTLFIEKAVSGDLDRFENWCGQKLDSSRDLEKDLVLPFQVSGVRGAILAGMGAAPVLEEILSKLPQATVDSSDQPVSLGIELGRTKLSLMEVKSLTVGDVVLIETGPAILKGKVEIRPFGKLLFQASLSETKITIQEIINMDPTEETGEEEGGTLDVADVPIELVFEIGRQQISVTELGEIQPGSTLSLENSLEDALVTVRANGKAIGTGELVSVGDRVGVRLK